LSGGDPFMLADEKLEHLLRLLVGIRHLRRLRVHTRMPTAAPGRVTNALLDILKSTRLPTVLVSHCNHPGEIDAEAGRVFARIRDGGITLLNQAVLLQGVNDDAEVLISLSERLFEYGALPYYLHLLDRVAGAGHFEVTIERAQSMHEELRRRLPGYLVPRLVREIPGAPYKIPVL
jgi:KamA family protein